MLETGDTEVRRIRNQKRKALENARINFYSSSSSSQAGCSVRGATNSVPQGQPSIPGRPRASKAVLQTLATAMRSLRYLFHTRLMGMTHNNNTPSYRRVVSIFKSFPLRIKPYSSANLKMTIDSIVTSTGLSPLCLTDRSTGKNV